MLAALPRSSCDGLRAPAQPGRPSKNGCGKIGFEFFHAVYIAKLSETMFSELAVGFENFCWRAEMRPAPRAQGPPRLAAGAGDRNAETLKDFYMFGSSAEVPRAFFFGSDQANPRARH